MRPADVIRLLAAHVSSGSVEEIMALYEPGAVYLSASGEQLHGGQIRENFRRLATLQPHMSGEMLSAIVTEDIALVHNRWDFRGQAPDGTAVRSGGISAVVLRRRGASGWGILIDDPWGGARRPSRV